MAYNKITNRYQVYPAGGAPPDVIEAGAVEVNLAGTLVFSEVYASSGFGPTSSRPFFWIAAGKWSSCRELPSETA